MNILIIYPKWPKLGNQREFHLPPHGPVAFAACISPEHAVTFIDENREAVDFNDSPDFVCISMMLTSQVPRGWEIADAFRSRGIKVIFGGIATTLHADETAEHADAVFLGEAEGRFDAVMSDLNTGKLKKVYDYLNNPVDITIVGTARREILRREHYQHKGIKMPDLIHASRGCRFTCYPCCVEYLGGRSFRPRPIDKVISEVESIDNSKLFFVDNSLAQDGKWEIDLFNAMAPLKRHIISHPVKDDPAVLKAAADAGLWWVYQAIFDTSDYIRDRVKRLKDHGVFVEGTILLGIDEHTEDDIKRLVDFLLEINLDLAEFTVLTPFPHTRATEELEKQGRILNKDWRQYTAGNVVFQPANMSIDTLANMYEYAWDTFYKEESQELRMARILRPVLLSDRQAGRS